MNHQANRTVLYYKVHELLWIQASIFSMQLKQKHQTLIEYSDNNDNHNGKDIYNNNKVTKQNGIHEYIKSTLFL